MSAMTTAPGRRWVRALIGTALDLSEADTWDEARWEWTVISETDNGSDDERCVCGHDGLRYLYHVHNRVTGADLYPIGTSCIELFENDELVEQVRALRDLGRLRKRYARGAEIGRQRYSRRALRQLQRLGVVTADELVPMLRAFNAPDRVDDALYATVRALVQTKVVPYLLQPQPAAPTTTDEEASA